ncbi:hypothetical protein CSAL01_03801 [Colletotrichum salicis]|uniref:Uncharacterized protein n=1 Tax=Colletotrichum salicis TaxID=1209931 RepID=A0A135UHN5_9PEZI|nr:hypothetical protein CSAL01_03801 [Colletotrichum salicis]
MKRGSATAADSYAIKSFESSDAYRIRVKIGACNSRAISRPIFAKVQIRLKPLDIWLFADHPIGSANSPNRKKKAAYNDEPSPAEQTRAALASTVASPTAENTLTATAAHQATACKRHNTSPVSVGNTSVPKKAPTPVSNEGRFEAPRLGIQRHGVRGPGRPDEEGAPGPATVALCPTRRIETPDQTNGTSLGDAMEWKNDPVTRSPTMSYRLHNLSLANFKSLHSTAIDNTANAPLAARLIPPPANGGRICDLSLNDVLPQLPPVVGVKPKELAPKPVYCPTASTSGLPIPNGPIVATMDPDEAGAKEERDPQKFVRDNNPLPAPNLTTIHGLKYREPPSPPPPRSVRLGPHQPRYLRLRPAPLRQTTTAPRDEGVFGPHSGDMTSALAPRISNVGLASSQPRHIITDFLV